MNIVTVNGATSKGNQLKFLKDGKFYKVPNGIAHFLEHKVFVQENGPQPEDYFAQSGGVCNAYTTFKNTSYSKFKKVLTTFVVSTFNLLTFYLC